MKIPNSHLKQATSRMQEVQASTSKQERSRMRCFHSAELGPMVLVQWWTTWTFARRWSRSPLGMLPMRKIAGSTAAWLLWRFLPLNTCKEQGRQTQAFNENRCGNLANYIRFWFYFTCRSVEVIQLPVIAKFLLNKYLLNMIFHTNLTITSWSCSVQRF